MISANNLSFTVNKKSQVLKTTDAIFDLFSLIRLFPLWNWNVKE